MGTFTDAEIEYLKSQLLGRLATVGPDGGASVRPVGFQCDADTGAIVIGSARDMAKSKKYRDAKARPMVSFVIDDLASVDPWTPRGIEIRGVAETHDDGGEEVGRRFGTPFPYDRAWIRIRPRRILSWGIDTGSFELVARDVA